MSLIIVEGPDNVGKTTQIRNISKLLNDNNIINHTLHYSNLQSDILNGNEIRKNSKIMYDNMINISNSTSDFFISDRFHLGEYVYGKIYRNYDNPTNIFDIEKLTDNILLIVLIDSAENLISRDDNKSFSINKNIKNKEIELFIESYNLSKFKKILINIENKNIDSVWSEIHIFLNEHLNLDCNE